MFGGKKDEKAEAVEWSPQPQAPHRSEPASEVKTQIGPGTVIRGEVTVNGDVSVLGSVEGNLTASGTVEVMKGGTVKADIRGKIVRVVGGRVEGKIVSGDRVQLLTGAHVKGDIHSQSLKIEEGVIFQGACVMGDAAGEGSNVLPLPSDLGLAKSKQIAG
jgi:cytoskeletal protein CcmA (bactofilin family)